MSECAPEDTMAVSSILFSLGSKVAEYLNSTGNMSMYCAVQLTYHINGIFSVTMQAIDLYSTSEFAELPPLQFIFE